MSVPMTPEMAVALGWEQPEAQDHSETLGADVCRDFLIIPTHMIDAGERLRPIDPVWAEALGRVMRREGQRTPIEVFRLPGQNRWTVAAGGHRLAGAIAADIAYLKAQVVSANRDDRRMGEVSENLWRKDLEPIDRAAFIAEAVAIHKRRAGLSEDEHRSKSVAKKWQQELSAETNDTLDTMSNVYGWTDEVGHYLGFSGRTIRRDLMLYRRLAPSLVARLRDARHPVATNATQLRTLAKLDEAKQSRVVGLMLDEGLKSVGDALKLIDRKPVWDAETKRLNTVLGAIKRMGAAERLALFQSPNLHNLAPAEARRLLAPMLRDGTSDPEVAA